MNRWVIIYTSEGCTYCKKMKQWLKRNKIMYDERKIEVEENRKKLLEKKVLTVPYSQIIENENEVSSVSGFNEKELDKLLGGN